VADLARNRRPISNGTGGRIKTESVADLERNTHLCLGLKRKFFRFINQKQGSEPIDKTHDRCCYYQIALFVLDNVDITLICAFDSLKSQETNIINNHLKLCMSVKIAGGFVSEAVVHELFVIPISQQAVR
jgi:hypothetical protein